MLADYSVKYNTTFRKWNIASYSQSNDPSVYAKLMLDTKNMKEFIDNFNKRTGKKLTVTLFWAKVIGEAIKENPDTNMAIRFGKVS
jgi:hypothetical protein